MFIHTLNCKVSHSLSLHIAWELLHHCHLSTFLMQYFSVHRNLNVSSLRNLWNKPQKKVIISDAKYCRLEHICITNKEFQIYIQ